MKKLLISLVLAVVSFVTLCAFTVNRDVTLSNERLGQKLFLYTNGRCVVTTDDGQRGTGKYNMDGGNRGSIYIDWDNGHHQQGSYIRDEYSVTSVYIEGVQYTVGRRVVPRRR